MKLDITEVYFVKQSIQQVNIKASDAPLVSALMDKIDKEYNRLEKLELKKQPAETMEVAK
tara:strand:- start:25646 stop:25825 length:180 start_codon:yes stop_codon:yes gene_type:complete